MNWRRGAFRLWLVISAIWFVAIGTWSWFAWKEEGQSRVYLYYVWQADKLLHEEPANFPRERETVIFDDHIVVYIPRFVAQDGKVFYMLTALPGEKDQLPPDRRITWRDDPVVKLVPIDSDVKESLTDLRERAYRESRRAFNNMMVPILAWSIGLPVGILAVGASLGWAMSGFSSKPKS